MDDFKRFRDKLFALCNFPFVLTVSTKANILKLESSVLMREKLQVCGRQENFAPGYLDMDCNGENTISSGTVFATTRDS